jgi:hypothetical protein
MNNPSVVEAARYVDVFAPTGGVLSNVRDTFL